MKKILPISILFPLILIIVVLVVAACDDILEPDIRRRSVVLLSPADSLELDEGETTFWWDKLDDATNYQLQVITPDFDSPRELVLDTLLTGNSFVLEMGAGKYAWRVGALNSAYQTGFSTRSLTILSANDLKEKQVILLAPADNLQTSTKTLTFGWEKLATAESYVFQLVGPDFDQPESLIADEELTDNSITISLPAGEYQWRVKAVNSESSTEYVTHSLSILP